MIPYPPTARPGFHRLAREIHENHFRDQASQGPNLFLPEADFWPSGLFSREYCRESLVFLDGPGKGSLSSRLWLRLAERTQL